jgi:hypothetical protein
MKTRTMMIISSEAFGMPKATSGENARVDMGAC